MYGCASAIDEIGTEIQDLKHAIKKEEIKMKQGKEKSSMYVCASAIDEIGTEIQGLKHAIKKRTNNSSIISFIS